MKIRFHLPVRAAANQLLILKQRSKGLYFLLFLFSTLSIGKSLSYSFQNYNSIHPLQHRRLTKTRLDDFAQSDQESNKNKKNDYILSNQLDGSMKWVTRTLTPHFLNDLPSPGLLSTWNIGSQLGPRQVGTTSMSEAKRNFWKLNVGTMLAIVIQLFLCSATPNTNIHAVHAASYYGTLSEEQKVVAEAWRLLDNSFLDRTFNGIDWFQVREQYVKKSKYSSAVEAQEGIRSMTALLGDKYTRYLSPSTYQSIVNSATGMVAGTGIEISIDKNSNQVYASDVQENSPAQRAGIRPGDVFVEVDGVRFLGDSNATPDDVAVKLRGPQGSKVGVVMERKNGNERIDVILTREPITITSVRSYVSATGIPNFSGKVGVIRIKSFSATTANTVAEQFRALRNQGATTFVIDVRGNPGGLLPGGVDTAALFLDVNQPLVFVVNKVGVVDAQSTLSAGIDLESPLVILVDGNTASAAEVFTAALSENQRAMVVGEQTFGKGIVQTIRDLALGTYGGLAITVARYETPLHHNINLRGIPVDVSVPIDCPKDDAIMCFKSIPNPGSIFRLPVTATNR